MTRPLDEREALEVLEQFPYWFHALRGASPGQVARFAAAGLRGARLLGWPDDGPAAALTALQDAPWDTAKLGVTSGRLYVCVPPAAHAGAAALIADTLAAADAAGYRYLVTRLDAGDLHVVQLLEQAGFVVVDAILSQYVRTAEAAAPAAPPDVAVRAVRPDDAAGLAALAAAAFTMSRFHSDPSIGVDLGRSIYREWGANLAGGLNDLTLVAELDGALAGFLSCKEMTAARASYGFGYGRIELVAVAEAARGRGVIDALTATLLVEARARTWEVLGIGTQIANVRAIRAYQRVGFAPGDSIFTLRRRV